MFSFVRKASRTRDSNTLFCFLKLRLLSTDSTPHNSFTVSYLTDSCGLSQQKAISASRRVKFKTLTNPNSVLAFFKANGFPDDRISNIIERMPRVLTYTVLNNLKPKFDFLKSEGLSGPDLVKSISAYPFILHSSLGSTIIPSVDFLKSILETKSKLVQMIMRWPEVLVHKPQTQLLPNVELLRTLGVRDSNIAYLLLNQNQALLKAPAKFAKIVEEVKMMGFDPSRCLFVLAIKGLTSLSRSTLAAKVDVYRRWGWSAEMIQYAFRKQPYCMMASEKKIMETMAYLVNDMGYSSSSIAKQPGLLLYSFEKRIRPRCLVIRVLVTNGLLKKCHSLSYVMNRTEKDFLKNYVEMFEERVPDLLNIYQGKGKLQTPP